MPPPLRTAWAGCGKPPACSCRLILAKIESDLAFLDGRQRLNVFHLGRLIDEPDAQPWATPKAWATKIRQDEVLAILLPGQRFA
jgi:hypothetical protein